MAVAALFLVAGLASAASGGPDGGIAASDGARDAHQHGTTEGHLHPEGSSSNVALVSKLKLKNVVPEKIADVGVFKGYAYLAAWGVVTCKYSGVHVVDVRNPASPKEVAFIVSKEGSYPGEGVQALHIDTPAYNGDILVSNNEKCKEPAGFGGMNIYDISKPTSPTPLVEGIGDSTVSGQGKKDAHEIHSVFAWDAGDKAYAVIVDNEEGTDVDIIDITDPRKASLIAEYDLDQRFPQILQAAPANLVEVFLHDMVVKEIGGRQVMLLSYWDAGYVAIDVTNGHSDFCPSPPNSGIAVLDARNPSNPVRVGTLQNPVGTSAEDVTVYTARYGPLAGRDIAASGIQWCGGARHDPAAIHGLQLWDVTNPAQPKDLGFLDTGCCTRGVHEFEIANRPDLRKTFAYVTVPAGHYPDPDNPDGIRDALGLGDFRLIDITDPRNPRRPAPGSRRASAICASGTSPTWPRPSRSARTTPRTRSARTTRPPAIT
jgi:hypothetical protein